MGKICVIVEGYPTKNDPVYAFIKPVVCGFADAGNEVSVIVPQSITSAIFKHKKLRSKKWIDKTLNGNSINIYQPIYMSLSNIRVLGKNISRILFDRVVEKCYKRYCYNSTHIYAHFWDCGICAAKLSNNGKIPVYVASGESKIRVYNSYSEKTVKNNINYISGVIGVSNKNLKESSNLNLIAPSVKTIVLPNSIDTRKFYKKDKIMVRKELGISDDDIIGIFVGAFSNRKGVKRVDLASINISGLKMIYIGQGDLKPVGSNILFSGSVAHDDIAEYLNASDFFVLPTLAEGCCNAIVEAMACGLPIISSNRDFNDDILDETNSLRINPDDINQIRNAMLRLVTDKELREKLEKGAIEKAKTLDINNRVNEIMKFMEIY